MEHTSNRDMFTAETTTYIDYKGQDNEGIRVPLRTAERIVCLPAFTHKSKHSDMRY